MEKLTESTIESGDGVLTDLGLRTLRFFIGNIDEREPGQGRTSGFAGYVSREVAIRNLYPIVPVVLPALFSAFTSDETSHKGQTMILHIFYQLVRLVAWADGIDNELVQESLSDTFQSWMALFLQIIQSNPKQHFNLKRNALKCLVVIFRDLINFSRDSINLILKPAWKLLNSHLPIFTEVVAYNQPIKRDEDADTDEEGDPTEESFDFGEIYGVEGMTYHLLELLSSLV
jgi:hypothetical protein